jgi:hypothetical protein
MKITKKQQKENRKKWVAALRSGRYKQTKEMLRDKTGYCCLGVACQLALRDPEIKKHFKWEAFGDSMSFVSKEDTMDPERTELPDVVQNWLGLSSASGNFQANKVRGDYGELIQLSGSLAVLNDSRDMSFKDIAAFIEKNDKALTD